MLGLDSAPAPRYPSRVPKPRKQILLTQDLKHVKSTATRDSRVESLDKTGHPPVSSEVIPVTVQVTDDRNPKKGVSVEGRVASPVTKPKSPEKDPAPTASEIMEKLKFSPVEEMIKLYEKGTQTVLTKEGVAIEIPLDPAIRVKILSELAAYNHSKAKPVDMGGQAERSVNVQIVMFPPNQA